MGQKIVFVLAVIAFAILVMEALFWDTLEELQMPNLAVGVVVGVFVVLAIHWVVVGILRRRRERNRAGRAD